jgi:hypothetical protein
MAVVEMMSDAELRAAVNSLLMELQIHRSELRRRRIVRASQRCVKRRIDDVRNAQLARKYAIYKASEVKTYREIAAEFHISVGRAGEIVRATRLWGSARLARAASVYDAPDTAP